MFVLPYFRLLSPETGPWDLAISAATVLLFYPVILFSERHLPLLMGKYRASKANDDCGEKHAKRAKHD